MPPRFGSDWANDGAGSQCAAAAPPAMVRNVRRRIIMSKGVRTLNDPAAQSDQRVHVYVSGSIKTGLRAMIRAMKIYPVVINSVLAAIIVASSAHSTLADPLPTATPLTVRPNKENVPDDQVNRK